MKFYLLLFIIVKFVLVACSKPKPTVVEEEHIELIKNIEIICETRIPDSIKYADIKQLFKNENISIEKYRTLYKDYTENDPFNTLALLHEVELLITRDIQKAASEQQQLKEKPDN
jgi:hypothetical protein